jgi:CubicO group peptidase (beta-lactamase class C family)
MLDGRARTALVTLVSFLVVGCSAGSERPVAESTGAAESEYWPTDGWRTGDPSDHGFEADELAEIEELLHRSHTSVRSLLIVRDRVLVYEHYGNGADASAGHDVHSVTKSVVSALVGIALEDGSIEDLNQTVGELLAAHLPRDADPRTAGISVRDLLSMTAGLPDDADSPDLVERLDARPDHVRAILEVPLSADPGSTWAYSNVSSDLLAAIVADAAGRSVLDFARERLFGPLGIETDGAYQPTIVEPPTPEQLERYEASPVAWPTDGEGYHWGSGTLRLPARDLAKFGLLYLDGGRWDGEQLVPADYVRESTTTPAMPTGPGHDYAWQWWISEVDDHPAFYALGSGGQAIEVVPDLDLVAVVTSDPDVPGGDPVRLVEDVLVPAAED